MQIKFPTIPGNEAIKNPTTRAEFIDLGYLEEDGTLTEKGMRWAKLETAGKQGKATDDEPLNNVEGIHGRGAISHKNAIVTAETVNEQAKTLEEQLLDLPLDVQEAIKIQRPNLNLKDFSDNVEKYGTKGKLVVTFFRENGQIEIETINVANPQKKDVVVVQPSGEMQVIAEEKFGNTYKKTDKIGKFISTGTAVSLKNPFNTDIKIRTPWGSVQTGNSDCYLMMVYDDKNFKANYNDFYIIRGPQYRAMYPDSVIK